MRNDNKLASIWPLLPTVTGEMCRVYNFIFIIPVKTIYVEKHDGSVSQDSNQFEDPGPVCYVLW